MNNLRTYKTVYYKIMDKDECLQLKHYKDQIVYPEYMMDPTVTNVMIKNNQVAVKLHETVDRFEHDEGRLINLEQYKDDNVISISTLIDLDGNEELVL